MIAPSTPTPQQPTVPPVVPPRTARKENFQRYRSLSKKFTKLPDKIPNVPTMITMMIDTLEYFCQIILMETNLDKLRDLQIRLEQLIVATLHSTHCPQPNAQSTPIIGRVGPGFGPFGRLGLGRLAQCHFAVSTCQEPIVQRNIAICPMRND